MAQTRGKRVAGKKKPKSIKAKVTSKMSSTRRLSRMGKEMKKGMKGIVANYMTRSQVLRRLQITLRDFRRLCILKGIYPRDPKKKASGKDKAYYHIKDVGYLAHEPLLNKFREFKAFMKKVRKAISRGDKTLAQKREASAPQYTLDHLVRERYPRFSDALGDLDDALSLIHLFATLPADGPVSAERTERCRRLSLEWQYYVARAHCLSKVFVSVKGIYFQAEVSGQPITWIVPHSFTQVAPPDVDFRIMLTFLEFYETLLRFTLFKLYHGLDMAYPPAFDGRLEESGVYMAAVRGLPLNGSSGLITATSTKTDASSSPTKETHTHTHTPSRKVKGLEEKLAKLAAGEGGGEEGERGDEEEEEDELPEGALAGALGEVMADALQQATTGGEGEDEDENPDVEVHRRAKEAATKSTLFKGLKFFLAREVPLSWVHLVLSSFGGVVGWEGEGSPFTENEKGITHQIVDRPLVKQGKVGREYVQPQWIFDSINARMRLPLDLYAPGKPLPPHLSPFVDDEKEGYVPAYREQLDLLRGKSAAAGGGGACVGEGGEEGKRVEEEESEEEEEEEATAASKKRKQKKQGAADEDDEEEEGEEEEEEEDEEKALAKIMMPRKHQHAYLMAKQGQTRQKDKVEALMTKRRKIEEREAGAGASAGAGAGKAEKRQAQKKATKGKK